MGRSRIRVLVADDHPLFRRAASEAVKVRPDLELAGTAEGGRDALDQIRSLEPDVVLLDLSMADLSGMEVLRAVVRDGLQTRVLVCAASTDSGTVYECVAAGAAGYIDKGAGAEEICDAILSVGRGDTVVGDRLGAGIIEQIRQRGDVAPALTSREREVLTLLADGLSRSQIAVRLYVEPSTIKTHLRHLYRKLGVSDSAAAVAAGMRRGLLE